MAQELTPEATSESLPLLTETYTSNDDSVSFSYPHGWEVNERQGNEVILFIGDVNISDDEHAVLEHRNPSINIIIWDKVDQFFVEPGTDDVAFGVALWNRMDAASMRPPDDRIIGDVTELIVGNKHAASYLVQFGYVDTLFLAVEEAPNVVSFLSLGTEPGETDEWEGTLLAVAESIQLHTTEPEARTTESLLPFYCGLRATR